MLVEIITPEKTLFKDDMYSVQLPAHDGYLEILNNHAAMLCSLKQGRINVKKSKQADENTSFSIENGVAQVVDNKVTVLLNKVL